MLFVLSDFVLSGYMKVYDKDLITYFRVEGLVIGSLYPSGRALLVTKLLPKRFGSIHFERSLCSTYPHYDFYIIYIKGNPFLFYTYGIKISDA